MSFPKLLPTMLGLLILCGRPLPGQTDWTQWRGPNRAASLDGSAQPAAWPEQLQQKWAVPIGEGHSGPVVLGKDVYCISRQNEREVIRRLTLEEGREVWAMDYPAPYEMHPAARNHGKGPKSTPAVNEKYLVTLGVSGILTSLSPENGRVYWQKNFDDRFAKTSPLYGAAASPLIHADLVIVHVGGHDGGALIAFELETGKPRWEWTADGPGYASPILLTVDNVPQLVTQSQRKTLALNPADGKLLWEFEFRTGYDQNSVTPVYAQGLLVNSGFQQPLTAYQLVAADGVWKPEQVWKNDTLPLYMSSTVVAGGQIFGMTHRQSGQLFCADLKTGATLWSGPERQGDNCALIHAGPVILSQFTDGRLQVFENSREKFNALREYTVATTPTWAHPALTGHRLLTKDLTTLTCWELAP